jgi:hypothetical protein
VFLNAEVLVYKENGEIKSKDPHNQLNFFNMLKQLMETLFKTGKKFRVLH